MELIDEKPSFYKLNGEARMHVVRIYRHEGVEQDFSFDIPDTPDHLKIEYEEHILDKQAEAYFGLNGSI